MKEKTNRLKKIKEAIKKADMTPEYKAGMINGLKWAIAVLEDKEVDFININQIGEYETKN